MKWRTLGFLYLSFLISNPYLGVSQNAQPVDPLAAFRKFNADVGETVKLLEFIKELPLDQRYKLIPGLKEITLGESLDLNGRTRALESLASIAIDLIRIKNTGPLSAEQEKIYGSVFDFLIENANGNEDSVRRIAIYSLQALVGLGNSVALDALKQIAETKKDSGSYVAVQALDHLNQIGLADWFTKVATANPIDGVPTDYARGQAASALYHLITKNTQNSLIGNIESVIKTVQERPLLGKAFPNISIEELYKDYMRILSHAAPTPARDSAKALLIAQLQTSSPRVQLLAIESLLPFAEDPEIIPALNSIKTTLDYVEESRDRHLALSLAVPQEKISRESRLETWKSLVKKVALPTTKPSHRSAIASGLRMAWEIQVLPTLLPSEKIDHPIPTAMNSLNLIEFPRTNPGPGVFAIFLGVFEIISAISGHDLSSKDVGIRSLEQSTSRGPWVNLNDDWKITAEDAQTIVQWLEENIK